MSRRPVAISPASRFDEAYFATYYGSDPETRVHGLDEVKHLVQGVTGLAAYWGLPVESVLDVGAGTGLWRDAFHYVRPQATYEGIDVSPVACSRYGHKRRSIAAWKSKRRFDLVVCQGVLQYLDDQEAASAVENLAAMTGGLLYLEALTRRDFADFVDRQRTDGDVHLRPGSWYRQRLRPHFQRVGAGLYASRQAGMVFFELEAL